MARQVPRLCVGYVPGMDARRVSPDVTPFLSDGLACHPGVAIRTLPSTELMPTLVSGVLPHEHRIWQVSLKPDARAPSRQTVVDSLPDFLTTTVQCFRHLLDASYDLAGIPSRRRRRFELHRFKYTRRAENAEVLQRFGPYDSIFGLLGSRARYRFTKSFETLDTLLGTLLSDGLILDFVEMYALDLFQHWHIDRPEEMRRAYAQSDAFLSRLYERCERDGWMMLVLVDHGQEPVVGTIPLVQTLRRAGVSERDFSYFVEVGQARFWFHTERAREKLAPLLGGLANTKALSYGEMHDYGVQFPDDTFGELYLLAAPGYVFFPHDFYHPLANLFLGLTDKYQRSRVLKPIHRANHGYLPQHRSERGYAVLFDDRFRAVRPEIELIDFAPTVLALLGSPQPAYMRGAAAFCR